MVSTDAAPHPCPVCGYMSFGEPPGSHDICGICFWEDDMVQLQNVYSTIGANRTSLVDSQRNFREHGVMSPEFRGDVRAPAPREARDPDWRPFDPALDDPAGGLERSLSDPEDPFFWFRGGGDPDLLYWWRPGYWRRHLEDHVSRRPRLSAAVGRYVKALGDALDESPGVPGPYGLALTRAYSWGERSAEGSRDLRELTAEIREERARLEAGGANATVRDACDALIRFVGGYSDEAAEKGSPGS